MNLAKRNVKILESKGFNLIYKKNGFYYYRGPNGGLLKVSPFLESKSILRGSSKYKVFSKE
jgi:hypothetical protein